jgi:phage-related protein
MYKIRFYKDKRGKRPVADYIKTLAKNTDKDSRVKLEKINDYIQALRLGGTRIGEPYVKHLDGEIWELRPLRDRILFAAWDGNKFVLLHQFMKKTQKTPPHEIKQAKHELADWKERGKDDE